MSQSVLEVHTHNKSNKGGVAKPARWQVHVTAQHDQADAEDGGNHKEEGSKLLPLFSGNK